MWSVLRKRSGQILFFALIFIYFMNRIDEYFQLSTEFGIRIIGALALAATAGYLGNELAEAMEFLPIYLIMVLGAFGFLIGLILTPYVTTRPIRRARNSLLRMPSERLVAVVFGLLLGLLAGGLFSIPLSFLPAPFRQILPLASVVVFTYLSSIVFMLRQNDIKTLFGSIQELTQRGTQAASAQPAPVSYTTTDTLSANNVILLDTSVIIDGRIVDISKTGFLRATLLIPNFILRELQYIADSSDVIRRNRGRRGLEVLSVLTDDAPIPVKVTDIDAPDVKDADNKLVSLAKEMRCPIMTNDYNLNRVAEIQGVNVLNINDLANAVKVAFLPGEDLTVKIIQEGREINQGVGYLEDGTMVVVEDGMDQMTRSVAVVVTKVLQTSAGRMVFARFPTENEQNHRGH